MIEQILLKSNWRKGRRIDTSYFQEIIEKEGYDWFPLVEKFLGEFGNLRLVFSVNDDKEDSLHFDVVKAVRDVDHRWITEDYSAKIRSEKICVIGQAFGDHMVLLMDDQGKIYGGFDDLLYFIGDNGLGAIENICFNRKLNEL